MDIQIIQKLIVTYNCLLEKYKQLQTVNGLGTVNHNDLEDLQGGFNGEFYHLTLDELRKLQQIDPTTLTGKSAFENWKEENNKPTATVQEFLQSLKGEDGEQGLQGSPGINGQDGKSILDLYKELPGNERSTLQDLLDYLKGPKGDTGETGQQGPAGNNGITPNFSVGTVLSGNIPKVTISGTQENPILNFTLQNGLPGLPGNDGRSVKIYSGGDYNLGEAVKAEKGDLYFKTDGNVYKKTETSWDLILNIVGPRGNDGAMGPQGLQGVPGEGFSIYKTYPSYNDMLYDASVPEGKFVIIASNVEDPDNAKLYVKSSTGYSFISDLSGATGIKGERGEQGQRGEAGITPNITIGNVTTGNQTQVTLTGSIENPVLNFMLQKGADGLPGIGGPKGDTPTIGIGNISQGSTFNVTTSPTSTGVNLDFTYPFVSEKEVVDYEIDKYNDYLYNISLEDGWYYAKFSDRIEMILIKNVRNKDNNNISDNFKQTQTIFTLRGNQSQTWERVLYINNTGEQRISNKTQYAKQDQLFIRLGDNPTKEQVDKLYGNGIFLFNKTDGSSNLPSIVSPDIEGFNWEHGIIVNYRYGGIQKQVLYLTDYNTSYTQYGSYEFYQNMSGVVLERDYSGFNSGMWSKWILKKDDSRNHFVTFNTRYFQSSELTLKTAFDFLLAQNLIHKITTNIDLWSTNRFDFKKMPEDCSFKFYLSNDINYGETVNFDKNLIKKPSTPTEFNPNIILEVGKIYEIYNENIYEIGKKL